MGLKSDFAHAREFEQMTNYFFKSWPLVYKTLAIWISTYITLWYFADINSWALHNQPMKKTILILCVRKAMLPKAHI